MKNVVKAALFATALSVVPAIGHACTEAEAEELSGQLMNAIETNNTPDDVFAQYVEQVEAEYGGEPSEAQVCEAINKLIAKVEAGE